MIKWIETTGRSEEDAIAAALIQLGLDRDDVSIEVLERAKTGFLGFGSNPAKVRVSYEAADETPPAGKKAAEKKEASPEKKGTEKPAPAVPEQREPEKKPASAREERKPAQSPRPVREEKKPVQKPQAAAQPAAKPAEAPSPDGEKARRIEEFLTGLLEHLNVRATPEISVTPEGSYKVVLQGKGLGAIIGRRGETLDAIQQLTNYAVNRGQSKRSRIHIDAENYRARREESLRRLAEKMAGKVVKFRRNMALEPMNAYERHVIHTALQDYPGVTTYSTGAEPNRRTVVAYEPAKKE